MEFEIDFPSDGPADVEMSVSGVPTVAGLRLLNEQLVADPRFRAGLTMLVDVSGVEAEGISSGEVEEMSAPMVLRDWEYPPAAVAIVAPRGPTYDNIQLYRAHVGGSKSKRTIFRSREEAVAWLEERRQS